MADPRQQAALVRSRELPGVVVIGRRRIDAIGLAHEDHGGRRDRRLRGQALLDWLERRVARRIESPVAVGVDDDVDEIGVVKARRRTASSAPTSRWAWTATRRWTTPSTGSVPIGSSSWRRVRQASACAKLTEGVALAVTTRVTAGVSTARGPAGRPAGVTGPRRRCSAAPAPAPSGRCSGPGRSPPP